MSVKPDGISGSVGSVFISMLLKRTVTWFCKSSETSDSNDSPQWQQRDLSANSTGLQLVMSLDFIMLHSDYAVCCIHTNKHPLIWQPDFTWYVQQSAEGQTSVQSAVALWILFFTQSNCPNRNKRQIIFLSLVLCWISLRCSRRQTVWDKFPFDIYRPWEHNEILIFLNMHRSQ